jgi:hypothetical protein
MSISRRATSAELSKCTTNAHSETGQTAVCCQNLPLGALSSRSAPSMLMANYSKSSVFFWTCLVNVWLLASLILALNRRWVISTSIYSSDKATGTHWVGGWVGFTADMWEEEYALHLPRLELRSLDQRPRSLITIPNELEHVRTLPNTCEGHLNINAICQTAYPNWRAYFRC